MKSWIAASFPVMDKTVLVNTDIDKTSEVGDVGDDARQFHADGEVVDGVYVFVELEHLELRSRVATGFVQFVHDVLQRGHPDRFGDVILQFDLLPELFVGHQVGDRTVQVGGHLIDHFVAFRVYSTGVQGVLCATYAEESGSLLEGFGSEARHFHQCFAGGESPVLVAVIHDVLRQGRSDAGNVGQQLLAGGVQLHSHVVDAALHGGLQTLLQHFLVHIVLVLPHADGFRVNLHQFGQRIH